MMPLYSYTSEAAALKQFSLHNSKPEVIGPI
jgi:hypothetical protein